MIVLLAPDQSTRSLRTKKPEYRSPDSPQRYPYPGRADSDICLPSRPDCLLIEQRNLGRLPTMTIDADQGAADQNGRASVVKQRPVAAEFADGATPVLDG